MYIYYLKETTELSQAVREMQGPPQAGSTHRRTGAGHSREAKMEAGWADRPRRLPSHKCRCLMGAHQTKIERLASDSEKGAFSKHRMFFPSEAPFRTHGEKSLPDVI